MYKYGYKEIQTEKLSRKEILDFWRKTSSKSSIEDNSPSHYLKGQERSIVLLELIKEHLLYKDIILEIGCNVGRNLNALYQTGYKNLYGIELNKEAIQLMKKVFPAIYNKDRIINSSIEDTIKTFSDNSFDLTFTMAVFEHIHYESDFIFDEVMRISKKYILTIEDEKTVWSNRHFCRNYKDIFEKNEWRQIFERNCQELKILDDRFWVRLFKKEEK